MSFDFVKIFKEIDLHKNDLDIDNFMTTIINHCHEMQPNKSWDLFKELDYTTEVKNLASHVIDSLKKSLLHLLSKVFGLVFLIMGTYILQYQINTLQKKIT